MKPLPTTYIFQHFNGFQTSQRLGKCRLPQPFSRLLQRRRPPVRLVVLLTLTGASSAMVGYAATAVNLDTPHRLWALLEAPYDACSLFFSALTREPYSYSQKVTLAAASYGLVAVADDPWKGFVSYVQQQRPEDEPWLRFTFGDRPPFVNDDAVILVDPFREIVVVVFRGSVDRVNDWSHNLDAPVKGAIGYSLRALADFGCRWGHIGQHSRGRASWLAGILGPAAGYRMSNRLEMHRDSSRYDQVLAEVKKCLASLPESYTVLGIGHSLGGGLAAGLILDDDIGDRTYTCQFNPHGAQVATREQSRRMEIHRSEWDVLTFYEKWSRAYNGSEAREMLHSSSSAKGLIGRHAMDNFTRLPPSLGVCCDDFDNDVDTGDNGFS